MNKFMLDLGIETDLLIFVSISEKNAEVYQTICIITEI